MNALRGDVERVFSCAGRASAQSGPAQHGDAKAVYSRDAAIDALRASALLGILVVNLPFFALLGGFAGTAWEKTGPALIDIAAAALIQGLFESKFILIFSALFGFGTWWQLQRHGTARYVRRLMVLAGLGVANLVLLFESDILLPYAVMGLGLLALEARSNRTLLAIALALWAAAVLGNGLFGLRLLLAPEAVAGARIGDQAAILASGSFGAILAVRLHNWVSFQGYCLWSTDPLAFAAMLFGFLGGRYAQAEGQARLEARVCRIAGLVAVPALAGSLVYGVLAAIPSGMGSHRFLLLTFVLRPLFALPLSLVLIACGLAALRHPRAATLRAILGPAGRMSMTLYLGFSVATGLLFYGYGLGLHGRPTLADTLWISAALFAGFVAIAALWERTLGQGPAERLLTALVNPRREACPSRAVRSP